MWQQIGVFLARVATPKEDKASIDNVTFKDIFEFHFCFRQDGPLNCSLLNNLNISDKINNQLNNNI
jgi:hypothetical protein